MPLIGQLASPILRTAAGFHPDEAWLAIGKVPMHLFARELLVADLTGYIVDTVNLEDIFCDVDANVA